MGRREEFINYWYDEYHEIPSEEIIEAYCGGETTSPRQSSFSFHTPAAYEDDGASELLSEFKNTFRDIKLSAKRTYESQQNTLEERPYIREFYFLLLLFLSKASLYFLLKRTHEIGLDVSDF